MAKSKPTFLQVGDKEIKLSNPDKLLWNEPEISKLQYVTFLSQLAPYIIPHCSKRLLTTIRYPDGIDGESFYQKNKPTHSPEWVQSRIRDDVDYIMLENIETLVWLGTQACLEFHTSFHYANESKPLALVIDLDPMMDSFDPVAELALRIHEEAQNLGLHLLCKTSGATGIQLYAPIERKYSFDQTRQVLTFLARYFAEKYPQLVTIERAVKQRGSKIYFDYLQHWTGKTIASVYSPRARKGAPVSTPIEWEELRKGLHPTDFNILNIIDRLKFKGDLFGPLLATNQGQSLDHILTFLRKK